MAVPHDRITAVLLAAANAAELLPYLPENRTSSGACDHHHSRVGGFFFSAASGSLAGEVLPPVDQTWLALAAFDHLSVPPPAQISTDRTRHMATLLRRRMRFLELLVRVSMTRQCDWQTCIATNNTQPDQQGFSWQPVLQELTGDTWLQPQTQRCVATMRWRHPRFLIQWDHHLPDNVPEMLEIFLMGIATKPESADDWMEDVTLRQLFHEERKHHTRDETRVVELGVAICAGRVTTSLLFHLVEVLQRFGAFQFQHRGHTQGEQQQHIEFRVTTLAFTSLLCTVASSALENLGALVRSSKYLHIQEIKLGNVGEMEDRCVQQCISDWIVPAPVPVATKAATTTRIPTQPSSYGLRRLFLENAAKPFAVVGATARCDTFLQQITTGYSATDMDSMAAWLAFGFFHRDSATSVARVALRMPGHTDFDERTPPYTACTLRFVEIFARALRATVASQDLAPLDAKTTRSATLQRKRDGDFHSTKPSPLEQVALPEHVCVFVELKTSTKARRQPLARSAVIATLAPAAARERDDDEQGDEELPFERLTQFQVLRRLREWVAVVVPGFGAGWIPLRAVSREWTRPSASDSTQVHGIRSFSWTGGSLPLDPELKLQHGDALMELLAIIGGPLTTLQLPSMFLQNHHVARILSHCPNLHELNLYGNRITDVEPLVDSYARGDCRITSLNVAQHSEIHDVVARQCIEILTPCDTRAQRLTRLVVRLSPYTYQDEIYYSTAVIPQLLEALLADPALEYVRVHSDTDHQNMITDELSILKCRMRSDISPSDRPAATGSDPEALPVGVLATNLRVRDLPLACTLAMLSIVHHASTQHSALSSMDVGVLGMVLEMAGTRQPCVIDIVGDQIVL